MSNFSNQASQTKKSFLKNIISEPEAKPIIKDKTKIKKDYYFWRNSILITSYVIYIVAYLGRKNFSIAMPFMKETIGITTKDQGLILAVSSIVYGIGKFINGSIADRSNVRTLLPINLMLANGLNIMIAIAPWIYKNYTPSHQMMVIYMCLFWGASNWFQSALFPFCAKSLIRWFPNSNRATWWARWSTSHELGSFLALNSTAYIASAFGKFGFEAMFFVPFAIALIIGIIGFFSLRDRPVSIGLPDVEEICGTKLEELTEKEKQEKDQEEDSTYFQILKKYVLKNKVMWNLALIYFCVYVFRNGPIDWIFKILAGSAPKATSLEALQNIDKLAALKTSMLCAIGFFGTFFAPLISEKLFKGRRAPANFWCLVIGAISVIGMWLGASPYSPIYNNEILKNIVIFTSLGVAGFTVCVPQVLVGGICAVESSSKRVASAASGFAGLLGYFGAAFGHIINGIILDYSMQVFDDARLVLVYWGVVALIGALLCIPLWNTKANKEYSH
ncbi:MAG: MFS transporter [Oscillospiraceae bacterium]|nr:MFS transporter [Oscillospiraceae bacterium]